MNSDELESNQPFDAIMRVLDTHDRYVEDVELLARCEQFLLKVAQSPKERVEKCAVRRGQKHERSAHRSSRRWRCGTCCPEPEFLRGPWCSTSRPRCRRRVLGIRTTTSNPTLLVMKRSSFDDDEEDYPPELAYASNALKRSEDSTRLQL